MSLPMPNFQLRRPFIDALDHLYMLLEEKEQPKNFFFFFFVNFALKTSAH
ncbi:hypothetical protein NC652_004435 [Populus alba x Populus x berolinensis]|nr:hypothetical protein NC652_004435 [Populus alba x Populus x berolinensis]